MAAPIAIIKVAIGSLAATLLTACASDSNPSTPTSTAGTVLSNQVATSPAAQAVAKLTKNLTTAQVLELLGRPAATKPITAGGVAGEIWSYPFRGATETRMVPVAVQEVAAINPGNGQATTRSEPVYQNQDVEMIDTLHLLVVGDRLVEWSIVRDEKKQFH